MLEPKSLDLENQGIVKAGWNSKSCPSSSVFTDEQTEAETERDYLSNLLLQKR